MENKIVRFFRETDSIKALPAISRSFFNNFTCEGNLELLSLSPAGSSPLIVRVFEIVYSNRSGKLQATGKQAALLEKYLKK